MGRVTARDGALNFPSIKFGRRKKGSTSFLVLPSFLPADEKQVGEEILAVLLLHAETGHARANHAIQICGHGDLVRSNRIFLFIETVLEYS